MPYTAPLTVSASDTITAELWNTAIRDNWLQLATAWDDTYSPTLTASGGNPNLGSTGTASGAAKIIGKTCDWRAVFVWSGTGVSAGSGYWVVSLPATPRGAFAIVGHGFFFHAASDGSTFHHVELDSTTGGARMILNVGGPVGGSGFSNLLAGTVLSLSGRFEIA